jgi:uncharacterized membrane protein YkvA (DUF1232 family)
MTDKNEIIPINNKNDIAPINNENVIIDELQFERAITHYIKTCNLDESHKKHERYYKKLRDKIKKHMKSKRIPDKFENIILLAPDLFYLVWKLSLDPKLPKKCKRKVAFAVVYFISPIDAFPEALAGIYGYIDDIYVTVSVLNALLNQISLDFVLKYWYNDEDLLKLIRTIIEEADKFFEFIITHVKDQAKLFWSNLKKFNHSK